MTGQAVAHYKIFSIADANKHLPLIRVIVRDVIEMSNSIIECRERLDFLQSGRENQQNDLYDDELNQIEDSLDGDADTLGIYLSELAELGVEVRSLTEGQVEFSTMIGGQLVYLCWQYGEEQVDYWRNADDDFEQRQSIDLMFEDIAGV